MCFSNNFLKRSEIFKWQQKQLKEQQEQLMYLSQIHLVKMVFNHFAKLLI